MEKIKWGIVSTGHIANQFAQDFKYVENAELYAVASRSESKSRDFADTYHMPKSYGSYEELYNDPDVQAVYIATPHNYHEENVVAALRAGKAVLCEKPITDSIESFKRVKKVVEETGGYLMEGMWTYFLPTIRKAKEWIDAGRIGKVRHIKADFGFQAPFDPKARHFNPDLAGGSLLDVGIYPIAFGWYFTQESPNDISVIASKAETGVDDDVHMTMKFGDIVGSFHCAIRQSLPNFGHIIGDKGYITLPKFWLGSEIFLYEHELAKQLDHFDDGRTSIGFNFELEAVTNDLLQGKKASDIMPLSYSQELQSQMNRVMHLF